MSNKPLSQQFRDFLFAQVQEQTAANFLPSSSKQLLADSDESAFSLLDGESSTTAPFAPEASLDDFISRSEYGFSPPPEFIQPMPLQRSPKDSPDCSSGFPPSESVRVDFTDAPFSLAFTCSLETQHKKHKKAHKKAHKSLQKRLQNANFSEWSSAGLTRIPKRP